MSPMDKALVRIVEKKNQLVNLDYNDKSYDDVEEELHDLEDDFMDEYGDYLEDALEEVHANIKSDADVLLPIAYLANRYVKVGDSKYEVPGREGVIVESEKYPDNLCRLALVPNPTRFVLLVGQKKKEVVWEMS